MSSIIRRRPVVSLAVAVAAAVIAGAATTATIASHDSAPTSAVAETGVGITEVASMTVSGSMVVAPNATTGDIDIISGAGGSLR